MDWSKLLEQVLMVAIPVIVPFVVALLIAQIKVAWAKAKSLQPDLTYELEQLARMAVMAAEDNPDLEAWAEDKKAYALEYLEKMLALKGVTLDLQLIEGAIEAAVLQEFNKEKAALPVEAK
jgi:hypothetical protein